MHKYSAIFTAHALGISLGQIFQWIEEYTLPVLLQILPIILGSTGVGSLTLMQIVTWVTAALLATKNGQPLPPLPTP